jgi:hypothetical protein
VDILAPGHLLLVAEPGDGYRIDSGTSLAAPLVTGLIAVLLTERPELAPSDIRGFLPQWQDGRGRLNPLAFLVTAGLVPADAAGVYPYEILFVFELPHPGAVILDDLHRLRTETEEGQDHPPRVSPMHWGGGYSGLPGAELWDGNYMAISGVVALHDDGTASATGRLAFHRLENSVTGQDSSYVLPSHGMRCNTPPASAAYPSVREFRWEMPVVVDVTPVDTLAETEQGGDGPPSVEMTLSLGLGATPTSGGELPPVTILRDNLDECEALIDRTHDMFYDHALGDGLAALDNYPPWEVQEVAFDRYFDLLEGLNLLLVESGPYTLDEPVILREGIGSSGVVDHPHLTISYRTP